METLYSYAQPFFEWLLRSTVQASMVICLILLIQALLRNRLTARWHYALWLILVVRMILPWAPQSRCSIFNLAAWEAGSKVPTHVMSEPDAELTEAVGDSSATTVYQEQSMNEDGTAVPAASDVSSRPLTAEPELTSSTEGQDRNFTAPIRISQESADPATHTAFRLFSVLPFLWLAGALLLGGYIIICNLRLLRAAGVECPSTDKEMLELLEECRSEIGLRTIVALVPSEKVNTPILLGFVRPRLLVPKSITKELTREELRYVFLHELAHVKRHDIALGWLTALLQVLHWFNPLVWLAFHRMRSNRELACDAFVLSRTQGEGTQDYGLAIVSLLEHFSIPQSLPGLAGILESKSQLKRRIAMITQFKNNSYKWSPLAAISVFILACVVLLDAPRGKASEAAGRPEPTLRRIEVLNRATKMHSHPSFDGKYMVLGRSTGDVIRELATGKERDLARPGGGGFAFGESISPDNAKIAYYWYSIEKGDNDIRVASFDGSDDRLLLEAEKISGWFNMDAWSPDARFLFGRYTRSVKNNSVRLVKVSVDDGSMQYIEVVDANGMSKVDISSDGRFLAYDRRDKTTYTSDIFIFDLLENREAILVKHPADDKLLGWTPDGGHIFFTSDSTGTTDGWLLPVRQGKANGRPKLIKPGIGDINPIRFTKDGALYFAIQHESTNIYTVQLDIDAGKALSDVSPVREVGKDGTPDWSPDGRYLAYCSQPDRHKPQIIRIRTLTTGDERQLKLDLPHFDYLRWCPDSLHLLITGPVWGALSNVYKVNVQTGQYVALIDTDRENVRQAELSADGRMLVYRTRGGGNYNRLIMRDLETGHEKELLAMEDGWAALTFGNGWTLLPDGKHVALSIRDDSPGSGYLLQTMSVETGETKTIVPDSVGCLTSVNKGLDLLFVRRGKELWRVSAEGSQPQKVWESEQGIGYPRMHPDGKHLAFVSGISMSEMWLMENFLPRDIVE